MARLVVAAAIALLSAPALAQPSGPPEGTPPAEAAIWPFPPPDPKSWWDDERPKPPEAADPLAGRRLGRAERPIPIDNGVDGATYRLWGLQPLQVQLVRGNEMILEVWMRPTTSVRQTVVRVTLRRDGEAFVQARAGYACCEAGIARRVGFDAPTDGAPFRALRDHPMWEAPRDVHVSEGGGVSDAICVDGTAYDLTLVVAGRARSLRRACDAAEVGQVADALEAAFRAAQGHEPRIDLLLPRDTDMASARKAHADLIAGGGALKPAANARPQPEVVEPAPDVETAP
jgi:hypothetical protein